MNAEAVQWTWLIALTIGLLMVVLEIGALHRIVRIIQERLGITDDDVWDER
jgi:hypothetical protein